MKMLLYISTQSCGNPKCSSGPVDINQCKCSATYPSTCPSGFTKIINGHRLCSCEKKVKPTCPRGFYINSACTSCSIDTEPECPSGSSVVPSTARCKGTAKPKCPSGFVDHGGCKCVKEYVRQCSSGKLSWDGCSCTGGTSKPTCGYGCHLNWSTCRCYKYGKNKPVAVSYSK